MIPSHVAIIMDGNGRWAEGRGLPRTAGHEEGAKAVRATVRHARRRGVKWLTLYAFSSMNWGRPEDEVAALMDLLIRFLAEEEQEMLDNGIRLIGIGERDFLPREVRLALARVEASTAHLTGMTLALAVSYDGRRDLVRAAQRVAQLASSGALLPADVDEQAVMAQLSTSGMPDVDLLIRSSGEQRLSGFLPIEACYAELHFCDDLWPDFGTAHFDAALASFAARHRRFGLTAGQLAAG